MTRVEQKFALAKHLDGEMTRLQKRWATLLKRKMRVLRPLRRGREES